jgi:hypothetical protein
MKNSLWIYVNGQHALARLGRLHAGRKTIEQIKAARHPSWCGITLVLAEYDSAMTITWPSRPPGAAQG